MYKYSTLIKKMVSELMTNQESINVIDWFASHGQMISKKYYNEVLSEAVRYYTEDCGDTYELDYFVSDPDGGDIETSVSCEVWQIVRIDGDMLVIDEDLLDDRFTEWCEEEASHREYEAEQHYEALKEARALAALGL